MVDPRERERVIIAERKAGVTLAELGRRFGIGRERVRQIDIRGQKRLQAAANVARRDAKTAALATERVHTSSEPRLTVLKASPAWSWQPHQIWSPREQFYEIELERGMLGGVTHDRKQAG